MSDINDSMLDMYIYETSQNIEQLEQIILSGENSSCFTDEAINEIFRLMHTIKGSSAMMLFQNISTLAHSVEDLFFFLREQHPQNIDYSGMTDLILDSVDFMKIELEKIKNGDKADGDARDLIDSIRKFLELLKKKNDTNVQPEKPPVSEKQQYYIFSESGSDAPQNAFKATIRFQDGCEMENLRAYIIINNLKEFTGDFHYLPDDIIENDHSSQVIKEQGFIVYVKTDKSYEDMHQFFMRTIFLKDLELVQLSEDEWSDKPEKPVLEKQPLQTPQPTFQSEKEKHPSSAQNLISVDVTKLDKLMDLVGEMVIAEAMVIQNPDLKGQEFENFYQASRQLHKITTELQDMVMSIRMVPLANTLYKMRRIVRDMNKKLHKEVKLEIIGEETEVDKNIIEHISDPLMHLVRNAIDHGIESPSERAEKKKPIEGIVTLEAKNAGSDVLVMVKDDGKGLNKKKILAKARENGLLTIPNMELTDKDIYSLVFTPGFSTKEKVTEFSGRGVGMDVVTKNIEAVGGSASIDSAEDIGTTVTLKIPLTLAIIDGMNIRIGNALYTIPITAIRESFRPRKKDIIKDPDNNEMIMLRGECYPILRLHEYFGVTTDVTDFTEGILIMVEQDDQYICLFADELIGQQQVVVKTLPSYIKNTKKIKGLAGCTLLGDGSISLILDIGGLVSLKGQRGGRFG